MIDDGDGFVSLAEYQDPDAPFMFELEDDLSMLSPAAWYENLVATRGKGIKDAKASAAGRVFIDQFEQGKVNPRRLMNWWKTEGTREEIEAKSKKTIDELVEDPIVVSAAVRAFSGGVEQKWDDLYKKEEEANAMQMFGTGQAALIDRDGRPINRAFSGQVDPDNIFDLLGAPSDDQLESGDYNQNWYDALGELESEVLNAEDLGFTNLMVFNSDDDNDFVVTVDEAPDLGRDEVIDAVNVDSRGNIYARVISIENETLEDGSISIGLDGNPIPKEVRDIRVYSPDDPNGAAMFNSLRDHINQGNAQQYKGMMKNSIDASKNARRARVKSRIEDARTRADEAAKAAEAAAAGTTDPASTPEGDDAAINTTPPPSREEAPSVVEADKEALSLISKRLESEGKEPGSEGKGGLMSLVKNMPEGSPRSSHFDDASESLLGQNYSHREIITAFNDPRFSEALIESGYDSDRNTESRGAGGSLVDAFGNWTGHRLFKGMKSNYTKQVDKVESVLKSIMDSPAPIATADAATQVEEDTEVPPEVRDVATTELEGSEAEIDPAATEAENASNIFLSKFGANEKEIEQLIFQTFENLLPEGSEKKKDIMSSGDVAKVAWCAAFVGAIAKDSGVDLPEGDDVISAKKYKKVGETVKFKKKGNVKEGFANAKIGDIVIMDRLDPNAFDWQGHVGFFAGTTEDGRILILGGNQQDQINITAYPPRVVEGIRRVNLKEATFNDMRKITEGINLADVPVAGSMS